MAPLLGESMAKPLSNDDSRPVVVGALVADDSAAPPFLEAADYAFGTAPNADPVADPSSDTAKRAGRGVRDVLPQPPNPSLGGQLSDKRLSHR